MTPTSPVRRMASARLPLEYEEFQMHVYTSDGDEKEHLALVLGEVRGCAEVMVRVHSECITGDIFGSKRCDCGDQLHRALAQIGREGAGILVYLRQEGRGIGLQEKLRAYNLQDQGYDTVEANLMLGHDPDERDYSIAAAILADWEVQSVRLLTNNPSKVQGLQESGIEVSHRIPIEGTITPENAGYLLTKQARLDHKIRLGHAQADGDVTSTPVRE